MWQDWIVFAVQAMFVYSLIPTIRHKTHKPALQTALMTGAGMVALTSVYLSKQWWYGGFVAGIVAIQWFILAFQRYQLDARPGEGRNIPIRKLLDRLLN